uniref:ZPD protein n=1 Tax=Xenopus laevis TaxID=8355 RepID=A9ULW6_XENLA|nr:ZPD protein [Xenopus laevis]
MKYCHSTPWLLVGFITLVIDRVSSDLIQQQNEMADLKCDNDQMKITLLSSVLDELDINASQLHMNNPLCNMQNTSGLYLSIVLTHENHTFCGTAVQVNGSHLIYSNELTSGTSFVNQPVGPGSLITRSSDIRIHFSCVYKYDGVVSLPYPLLTSFSSVTFVVKEGIFNVTMTLYPTSEFKQPYEWLPVIPLSQNLNVQLQVHEHDLDNYFSLRIEDCWATPTANPEDKIRYPIISSGYPNDTTVAMIQTLDNSLTRFVMQMFHFINYSEVYLHCKVLLCHPNSTVFCNRPDPYVGRKKRDLESDYSKIVSYGPITLTATPLSGVERAESGMSDLALLGSVSAGTMFVALFFVVIAKSLKWIRKLNGPTTYKVQATP